MTPNATINKLKRRIRILCGFIFILFLLLISKCNDMKYSKMDNDILEMEVIEKDIQIYQLQKKINSISNKQDTIFIYKERMKINKPHIIKQPILDTNLINIQDTI